MSRAWCKYEGQQGFAILKAFLELCHTNAIVKTAIPDGSYGSYLN
jgi:hypothetical protein